MCIGSTLYLTHLKVMVFYRMKSNVEDGLFRDLFLFMSKLIWEADVLLNLLKTDSRNDC